MFQFKYKVPKREFKTTYGREIRCFVVKLSRYLEVKECRQQEIDML